MPEEAVAIGGSYVASAVFMDTLITIEVVSAEAKRRYAKRVQQAFGWFGHVEKLCSRFDENSELSRLSASPPGVPVTVSPLLFELVSFALSVARASGGAFDPTVGRAMEISGFNRNYLTGERKTSEAEALAGSSYRDILLDPAGRTVTLPRPLVLDLGAVAKGFAIDLAAEELRPLQGLRHQRRRRHPGARAQSRGRALAHRDQASPAAGYVDRYVYRFRCGRLHLRRLRTASAGR